MHLPGGSLVMLWKCGGGDDCHMEEQESLKNSFLRHHQYCNSIIINTHNHIKIFTIVIHLRCLHLKGIRICSLLQVTHPTREPWLTCLSCFTAPNNFKTISLQWWQHTWQRTGQDEESVFYLKDSAPSFNLCPCLLSMQLKMPWLLGCGQLGKLVVLIKVCWPQ